MKRLTISAMLTLSMLAAGCATVESTGEPGKSDSTYVYKEDKVTGSRLPRSDSSENYQGTKGITGQDYREYKSSTGLIGGP